MSESSKVYPSWRYHKSEEPRLVKSADEDAALGKSWADTPAAFEEIAPKHESKKEEASSKSKESSK